MVSNKMEDPLSSTDDDASEEEMESSDNENLEPTEGGSDEDVEADEDGSDADLEDSDMEDEDGDVSDIPDEEPEEEEEAKEEKPDEKSGWADAMAKVLRTNKDVDDVGKLLLSKAKKDYERKAKTPEGETQTEEGKEKVEGPKMSAKLRLKRKEMDSICRAKPTVLDRNREKVFTKLATKGVVQLFNAVRDHQKNIKTQLSQVGKSTRKREQVFKTLDKEEFLNVLSGDKKSMNRNKKSEVKKVESKIKNEDSETWSVLRDDFMMGAKMKDWDKEGDSD